MYYKIEKYYIQHGEVNNQIFLPLFDSLTNLIPRNMYINTVTRAVIENSKKTKKLYLPVFSISLLITHKPNNAPIKINPPENNAYYMLRVLLNSNCIHILVDECIIM